MDVGGATQWSMDRVVPRSEMLARLSVRYGPITPAVEETSGPADRFRRPDGPLIQIGELKRDPSLEMHTRGG